MKNSLSALVKLVVACMLDTKMQRLIVIITKLTLSTGIDISHGIGFEMILEYYYTDMNEGLLH